MRQFSLTEAKAKLSELLDLVESGEEVVIHRHGKAVARMNKAGEDALRGQREAAWQEIKRLRVGQHSGRRPGETLKDLIEEGRRF
jgi:antitoxin (DNA-binding transcriptional repressor) of toxin-antitoxin stability system